LKVPLLKELGANNKVRNVSDRPSDIEIIKQRKREGIKIPLNNDVQAKTTSTYLEYVKLVHNALPELDYDEIDLNNFSKTEIFGTSYHRFYDWRCS
jgi:isopentenyl diphosphate isomerase/L-lactate dehydrogenase-like FMN-dependent dehydrogenase